jgi:hypothetical protein
MTEVPTAHSTAAWLGCSRRRRCTMLKANTVIMKKGMGSMAEKIDCPSTASSRACR